MISPPVSVCLTTYNRGKSLAATIDSILAQTMGEFEFIISDDNSTDNTEEVCRRYASRDKRISYFRNSSNLRMPGNLNAAILRTSAPLVANLHDGDIYRPDLLEKWRNALEKAPAAAFVFNALESIDEQGRHLRFYTHPFRDHIEVLELNRFMLERLDSPVWGTVMARRACYDKVGMFKPEFGFISDVEMWMRLNVLYPVAYIAEPLIKVTPREITHPYAYIDWNLERIRIDIQIAIISEMAARGVIRKNEELRKLRKLREKRYLFLLGSCLKRGRWEIFVRGMDLFRADESWLLRSLGWVGTPFASMFPHKETAQR